MVTRRNTDRADGHAGNGDETSETTPDTDNPVLQRILRRMDQLQEQNQTLQEQNQTEPPLKDYDGTTDPQAHVTTFKTQMLKRGLGDAIQYKLFSGTLSGAALIWFSHLPPLSISDISDLLRKFLAQFSARRSRMMTSGKLFSIRQRADESLCDYLGRFNDASLLVINPNPELLVSAFEEGLQPGPFNESLAQSPAHSMQEIRNRADCYIKVEESNAEKRERSNNEGSTTQKTGKEQGHTFQQPTWAKKGFDNRGRNFQPGISWDDRRRPDHVSSYGVDTLTPLNTSRARILKEVYQSDLIRLPPQAEGPKGSDTSKWCDYHRAKGHDTEDCWTLMNRIERLIKEGYLGRYIEKRKGRGDKGQRRDEEGSRSKRRRDDRHKKTRDKEEERGVVTTIAGGFTRGGETSSARRRYVRQVITIQTDLLEQGNNHPGIAFTNEDFRGIQPHQDDPMVIDVLMAKYRVQRVLIDQGSSADVLYWSAFEKLQLPRKCLLPFAGSLMGFSGDSVEEELASRANERRGLNRESQGLFAELDPREDFFERRPQPTEELEEKPTVETQKEVLCIEQISESWIDPILQYLTSGSLPESSKAARKVQKVVLSYWAERQSRKLDP
ncbi:Retrotransposon gag domain [Sesbania bispinosa]|nr:Retrotransposon gag domain [Sesbania bispinosa]